MPIRRSKFAATAVFPLAARRNDERGLYFRAIPVVFGLSQIVVFDTNRDGNRIFRIL